MACNIKYTGPMTRFDLSRIDGVLIDKDFHDSLTDSVYVRDKRVGSSPFGIGIRYLNCGLDKELFIRILSLPLFKLQEIGKLVELGQKEFWVGEDDYWTDIDGIEANKEFLDEKGYALIEVDYDEKVLEDYIKSDISYSLHLYDKLP